MICRFVPTVTFVMLVGLAACSGGGSDSNRGTGASPTPPPVVTATFTFPVGDATSVPGSTAWDIARVKTTLTGTPGSPAGNSYDTLRVDVTFAQDVSNALPAPGQPLINGVQLGVGIALDVDANPNTGQYASCNLAGGLRPFEYFSDIGAQTSRLSDGNYAIVDPSGNFVSSGSSNPAGEAVTAVSGHVLSQSFFLPAVAVFSGGVVPRIGVAVAAYNGSDVSPTDCVPKSPAIELFTR